MTAYSIFSTLAAIALIFLLIHSIWNTTPEKRRAFVIPGLIQLFAASLALVRGRILPYFIPHEIVTILCYFFALYLTFTSAISIAAVGKPHRKKLASLWIITAVAFWILAIFA